MIEINSFNDKTQTMTTIRPFAWFVWPLELINQLLAQIRAATTGLRIVGGPVRITRRTGNDEEILECAFLTPIRRTVIYVRREEYEAKAKQLFG
jgi:hypothetical protein